MNRKTINALRKLSKDKTLSIRYEEAFNGVRGPQVLLEIIVGDGVGLCWTNEIPSDLFEEVKKDVLTKPFMKAKEDIKKLTNKNFTVSYEKTYYKDGTKATECGVYIADVGYFYSDNFKSSIKQLHDKIKKEGKDASENNQ